MIDQDRINEAQRIRKIADAGDKYELGLAAVKGYLAARYAYAAHLATIDPSNTDKVNLMKRGIDHCESLIKKTLALI